MTEPLEIRILLPLACHWAKEQENYILENGVPLDEDQQIDAYLVGVKEIQKVRLMKVDAIPTPAEHELKMAVEITGLLSPATVGLCLRYGIYIRSDCWTKRKLIVHELTHTMQYERLGGFEPFLKQYLDECLTIGYPLGSMELEAKSMESKICN